MHRAGLLADGRMLLTYRQMAGNSSLSAWCGDPAETVGYCVASRWGEGDGALLVGDALRIKTSGERSPAPPVYFLPPPEFDDSVVTIEATLRVVRNDTGLACAVNVNCANEVLFYPDRVEILNRPHEVYYLDGTKYHDYTIIRDATSLLVKVDGLEQIRSEELVRTRGRHRGRVNWGQDRTAFGTTFRAWDYLDEKKWEGNVWRWDNFDRAEQVGAGESYWKSVKIRVENETTMDVAWSWNAASNKYPDQYQRDHIVEVDWDPQADYGGSSWVQFPDGEIFVAYYTAEETRHQRPYIKGCYLYPSDFKSPLPPSVPLTATDRQEPAK